MCSRKVEVSVVAMALMSIGVSVLILGLGFLCLSYFPWRRIGNLHVLVGEKRISIQRLSLVRAVQIVTALLIALISFGIFSKGLPTDLLWLRKLYLPLSIIVLLKAVDKDV